MTQGAQAGALWQPRGVGGGRRSREEEDISIPKADSHADIQQKPIQYCKAIILQLKIKTYLLKCGPKKCSITIT